MLDSYNKREKETVWVETTASTSESRKHHFQDMLVFPKQKAQNDEGII